MARKPKLRCPSCKQLKAPDNFYRSYGAARGRQSWCKKCQKVRRQEKRETITLVCGRCSQPYDRVACPRYKSLLYRPVCCRCTRLEKMKAAGGYAPGYKGTKHFSGRVIGKWMLSAKRRGHTWAIEKQDLDEIYDRQGGRCALSGLPMTWTGSVAYRPSLDRIDSSKGYYKGNVQFLCSIVNLMKNRITERAFLWLCGLITRNAQTVDSSS